MGNVLPVQDPDLSLVARHSGCAGLAAALNSHSL